MRAVHPPFFFRLLSPQYLLCEIPARDKVLYLTFDDGPIPEVTPGILKILEEFNVRATFFVVGDNVRKHPDVFNQLITTGHTLGNHTFHHLNGWHTSPASYAEDVFRCEELVKTSLFRPPYGRFTPSQYFLLRKHFRFILWSVLTYDFDHQISPETCLKYAVENAGPGSVVVFHDSVKAAEKVIYALPRFLETFLKQGFKFSTIPTSNSSFL